MGIVPGKQQTASRGSGVMSPAEYVAGYRNVVSAEVSTFLNEVGNAIKSGKKREIKTLGTSALIIDVNAILSEHDKGVVKKKFLAAGWGDAVVTDKSVSGKRFSTVILYFLEKMEKKTFRAATNKPTGKDLTGTITRNGERLTMVDGIITKREKLPKNKDGR